MKANYVKKMAKQAFNKLVEAVEAGKSATLIEYLKTMGKFHNYSVGNAILIGFQKPDATRVAGFRTWQKLGRHVKKGEHGIAIMAPINYRRKIESEEADDKKNKDEIVTNFKTVHVFDISQTKGKPLPEFVRVKGDPADYTVRLKEFVSEQGIKFEYSDAIGSAEGVSSGGMIRLKKGLSAADEFSVLVHELAHEMLHKDRQNMPKEKKVRETEAEAVAYVVSQGVGLDVNTASSDYIQLYNGDKKTLMESLDRIQRTASEILRGIMAEQGNIQQDVEGQTCLAEAA
jgi:antirestriction protein ArdC